MHIKLRPSNQTRKSQEGLIAVFPSLALETIKYLIIILLFIFLGSFLALNTSFILITNQITSAAPKSLWSAWWNVLYIYDQIQSSDFFDEGHWLRSHIFNQLLYLPFSRNVLTLIQIITFSIML